MTMKGAGGSLYTSDGAMIAEIGGVSWQNICQGIPTLITQVKPFGGHRRTAGVRIEKNGSMHIGCGQHDFVFSPNEKGEFFYHGLRLSDESEEILTEFVEEYKEHKKRGLKKTPRFGAKK